MFEWYRGLRNPRGAFREIYLPILEGAPQPPTLSTEPVRLPDAPETPCSSLTIVHVNDLHHYHLQVDLPGELTRVRGEASKQDEVLYLSAGDEYTGTTLDSLLGYTTEEFEAGPAYRIQTLLGLDAAALGNHDFDRGPAVLEKAISEEASFPLLSANIRESQQLRSYSPAMIGVTNSGVRVGVVACTTPEELQVSPLQDATLEVTDPLSAVLSWYEILETQVDVVIILSHLGLNTPGSRHTSRVDDNALAAALHTARMSSGAVGRPPCCIIGGHTHTVIDPSTKMHAVGDIPIFQAGCNGRYLGVVRLALGATLGAVGAAADDAPVGAPRDEVIACALASWSGRLVPLSQSPAASPHQDWNEKSWGDSVDQLLSGAEHRTQQIIGTVHGNAQITARDVQNDRLCGECALINALTDLLQHQLPQLIPLPEHDYLVAACDASGIQQGFDDLDETEGATHNVTIADLYRILPYADSVMVAVVSPQQLERIIGSNCRRVLMRRELVDNGGTIQPMDWAHIARGFLHFSSTLRYKIERRKTEPHYGSDLRIAGLPLSELAPKTRVALVLNSFSARGNQGWGRDPGAAFAEFGQVSLPEMGFHDTGLPFRTAIIEALKACSELKANLDGRVTVRRSRNTAGVNGARSSLHVQETQVE